MTQELALHGGSVKPTSVSQACSKPLMRAATRAGDSKSQISEIVRDPELHAEAKQIAPVVRALAQGVTYEAFVETMQPLFLYAPPKDLPSDQRLKTAWFQIGHKAMADVPREALKMAVDLYISTSEYPTFPAWGRLRKLADPFIAEIMTAAYRIGAAARMEPPKAPPVRSAEDREKVRQMLAEFHAKPLVTHVPLPRETPHQMAARLRASA